MSTLYVELALFAVVVTVGTVKWAVTRWMLDGVTLRIETGLIRRDSRQLPLARIQAVDVAEPLLARMFGLAELRIRLAGAGATSGRLAYLAKPVAADLRARLLAGHHGLDLATPEPVELPVTSVPPDRLISSVLLSPATVVTLVGAGGLVALISLSKTAAAAAGGTAFIYLIALAHRTWRRIADQYGFALGHAADGIRIRRGLLSTVAETIPLKRVQAIRMVEPLLWRPFGWCRIEVDVAGSPGREQKTRATSITKALLPVGPVDVAAGLLGSLVHLTSPFLTKPPARVMWKAPLSYHYLAAGADRSVACAVTGRLRRTTTWVPLAKAQSFRRVQGPVQRRLQLATVHVDAAGRGRVALRDRATGEADNLLAALVEDARGARRAEAGSPLVPARGPAEPVAGRGGPPPGWYADPTGRHPYRYWDGKAWTHHVAIGGAVDHDVL